MRAMAEQKGKFIVSHSIQYIVIEVQQQLQQQPQLEAFHGVPQCSIVPIEQFQLKQQQELQGLVAQLQQQQQQQEHLDQLLAHLAPKQEAEVESNQAAGNAHAPIEEAKVDVMPALATAKAPEEDASVNVLLVPAAEAPIEAARLAVKSAAANADDHMLTARLVEIPVAKTVEAAKRETTGAQHPAAATVRAPAGTENPSAPAPALAAAQTPMYEEAEFSRLFRLHGENAGYGLFKEEYMAESNKRLIFDELVRMEAKAKKG